MAASLASQAELAKRYARAAFTLCKTDKERQALSNDLLTLRDAIAKSDDLTRLIRHPIVTRAEKEKAVLAVAKHLKCSKPANALLSKLAQSARLSIIPALAEHFRAQINESQGVIRAQLVSATELTAAQTKSVTDMVAKSTGKSVALDVSVDPSLIGGIRLHIGSLMIDRSVKASLQRLSHELKSAATAA